MKRLLLSCLFTSLIQIDFQPVTIQSGLSKFVSIPMLYQDYISLGTGWGYGVYTLGILPINTWYLAILCEIPELATLVKNAAILNFKLLDHFDEVDRGDVIK
jgi:hypothetical protein